jgi:hypothetical protein
VIGFKIHAARRRTRVKTCLPSADDHVGARARLSRSLSFGPGVKFELVGSLLGCVIVWEREVRGSAAGDRTFGLVSVGPAAFTAAGVERFPATAEKVMALHITPGEIRLIAVASSLAACVGGFTAAAISDHWSRRTVQMARGVVHRDKPLPPTA